jgi:hypothetical protein
MRCRRRHASLHGSQPGATKPHNVAFTCARRPAAARVAHQGCTSPWLGGHPTSGCPARDGCAQGLGHCCVRAAWERERLALRGHTRPARGHGGGSSGAGAGGGAGGFFTRQQPCQVVGWLQRRRRRLLRATGGRAYWCVPCSHPVLPTSAVVVDGVRLRGAGAAASAEEIKRAYKKKALQHHPDKAGGDADTFKKLAAAYEVRARPTTAAAARPGGRAQRWWLHGARRLLPRASARGAGGCCCVAR